MFTGLAGELARALVDDDIHCVVGDAAEGYNPTHDVCRLVIDAAVRMATWIDKKPVENFAFNLVGRPDQPGGDVSDAVSLSLDEAALARKLRVARRYAEMAGEVTAALNAWGVDAFGKEYFQRVGDFAQVRDPKVPPQYEQYGEKRVDAGTYTHVIRYHEHVLPLSEVLQRTGDGSR
ncbi:MAG: hypothetical protein ABI603_00065 [Acidobacteriota bacterium]